MVYHSSFVDDEGVTKACGCPLLPLKSHIRGPAPVSDQDKTDIVDEAITFFRANVFFRNFDIKSSADKLLIYLTFYINVALKRLGGCRTLAEGTKAIINLGLEDVPVPGESGFPFPGLFPHPQSQKEAERNSCGSSEIIMGLSSEHCQAFKSTHSKFVIYSGYFMFTLAFVESVSALSPCTPNLCDIWNFLWH